MGQTGKGLFISLPWYLRSNLISCTRPEVSCQAQDHWVWCDWRKKKKSIFSSWTQAENPSGRNSPKISDLREMGDECHVRNVKIIFNFFIFFQAALSFLSRSISAVLKRWPVTGSERRCARLHWMLRPRGTKSNTLKMAAACRHGANGKDGVKVTRFRLQPLGPAHREREDVTSSFRADVAH